MSNMKIKRLEVGDKVNVYFEFCPCEFGVTIAYKPVATGDAWILHRDNGDPVYVQLYSKIEKINE